MRTFYAGKIHGGCPNDNGWLAISNRKWVCDWERQQVYPNILYSNKDYATHWVTEYAVADVMVIYISI